MIEGRVIPPEELDDETVFRDLDAVASLGYPVTLSVAQAADIARRGQRLRRLGDATLAFAKGTHGWFDDELPRHRELHNDLMKLLKAIYGWPGPTPEERIRVLEVENAELKNRLVAF